jgi:uncharacterized protein
MDNKIVEDSTIFLTIAGSKSYGTNTPESDTDVRGVCIPKDKTYYFGYGLNVFEQQDKGWEDDRVIYDLRKFIKLAVDNNPNILELLFVDQRFWLSYHPAWLDLHNSAYQFLSKKVKHSFSGYAFAQLKRIKSHRAYLLNPPKKKPERSDYGLSEKKMLSNDSIGAIQWLFSKFLENSIEELSFSDATKEELRNVNYIGLTQSNMSRDLPEAAWKVIQQGSNVSDEVIDVMMKEKAYNNALNEWNAYEGWKKTRNPKRVALEEKFGFDTKHAMHLVRLMRMGIEILETNNLKVFRPDREELLAIRNGLWSYDQVIQYANDCEQKMNDLYKTTNLPNSPNRVFLDMLCQKVIERYINEV